MMAGHLPYETTVGDEGRGPAVVLVHGTPLDAHAWDGLVPLIASRHRVITYDLRGHGSAASIELPDSFESLAYDLASLLDALLLERAHVVGHSFGGQVVQEFAARCPERLDGLTVVCARSSPYPPFAEAARRVEDEGIEAIRQTSLERWFTPAALARDDPAVRYARARLNARAVPTWAAALRMIARFDLGNRLASLSAPARFVAAERDTVATADEMRKAATVLTRSDFVVEANVGHLFPVEQPERVARLLGHSG